MKKLLAAAAALALTALAFSPLQAQERIAVWTVPNPQTVEVKIAVEVDGVKTTERTVSIEAPPGANVTITKTATPTVQFVSVPDPDPFASTQASPVQYRMVCDGKSCQMVAINQTASGDCSSCGSSSTANSAAAASSGQRQGIIRRLINRLRSHRGRGCVRCGG